MLVPRLAAFSPERFASEYLGRVLTHLINTLKNQAERCVRGAWPAAPAAPDHRIATARLDGARLGGAPLPGPLNPPMTPLCGGCVCVCAGRPLSPRSPRCRARWPPPRSTAAPCLSPACPPSPRTSATPSACCGQRCAERRAPLAHASCAPHQGRGPSALSLPGRCLGARVLAPGSAGCVALSRTAGLSIPSAGICLHAEALGHLVRARDAPRAREQALRACACVLTCRRAARRAPRRWRAWACWPARWATPGGRTRRACWSP